MLPERVVNDSDYWPWATEMPDLDSDRHVNLLMGGSDDSGQSYIHWGPDFDELTVLPVPDYFVGFGLAMVSTAVHDIDGDGWPDILLGGYNDALNRGLQVLINTGDRTFEDQTQRRLGRSAWSPHEDWHVEHRFLDFNGDGTLDIVPQQYAYENGNVLAWLNDGTGHYVALKPTMFSDSEALFRLTWGGEGTRGRGVQVSRVPPGGERLGCQCRDCGGRGADYAADVVIGVGGDNLIFGSAERRRAKLPVQYKSGPKFPTGIEAVWSGPLLVDPSVNCSGYCWRCRTNRSGPKG